MQRLDMPFAPHAMFMRCGELTARSENFNPVHDLTISDLSFQDSHFSIFLKHSKTDRDGRGAFIHVARTNTPFCPFLSMSRYMALRLVCGPEDPLFMTGKGKL